MNGYGRLHNRGYPTIQSRNTLFQIECSLIQQELTASSLSCDVVFVAVSCEPSYRCARGLDAPSQDNWNLIFLREIGFRGTANGLLLQSTGLCFHSIAGDASSQRERLRTFYLSKSFWTAGGKKLQKSWYRAVHVLFKQSYRDTEYRKLIILSLKWQDFQ